MSAKALFFIMHEKFKNYLKQAILEGRKTAMTRCERIGKAVGDTFQVEDVTFEFTNIYCTDLMNVAKNLYRAEGFKTDTQFYRFWGNHHPDYMEQPLSVWVYEFKKVEK